MNVTIYSLSDPRTGFVRYIGKAIDAGKRLKSHLRKKPVTHLGSWVTELRILGLRPIMEELEIISNSNDLDWQEVEKFYVEYFRQLGCDLTNMVEGGMAGRRFNIEVRKKMSISAMGRKVSDETKAKISKAFKGLPRSKEWKDNISKSLKGRTFSEEHRNKLSIALKGRVISEEVRRKMSLALKGRKLSPEHIEKCVRANTGKKRSEESRARMRISNLGKRMSEASMERLRARMTGYKHSHHARKKMIESWKIRKIKTQNGYYSQKNECENLN